MAPSTVQIFRAVPTANLFLLLPLTAATYHLPLPLTARPSVDCRDRYPTPNSNFTGAHRLVHPYGSPTILWLSMVLSLWFSPPSGPSPGRSLRLSRPVFASALSAQGCRVENAHLSIYPFMDIYPIYPISARLPFDLPKPGDNSSSPPCVPFQPS